MDHGHWATLILSHFVAGFSPVRGLRNRRKKNKYEIEKGAEGGGERGGRWTEKCKKDSLQ
jgi:hypothetical protein